MGEFENLIKQINKLELKESNAKVEHVVLEQNFSQLLKNKKIKTIIHNFYIKENAGITDWVDKLLAEKNDYTVRFIMFQLLKELNYKENNEGLESLETILFLILSKDLSQKQDLEYLFPDALVNEFKNVNFP